MDLIKEIDETISFNENNIRVIGTYDEPWFVAKDICNILELKNITEALKILPEKWRGSKRLNTFGGEQNMIIINESGLYKLIMRSNKPIAQKFQEVVCEEILPSIRKKGEFKIQTLIDKNKQLAEEKQQIEEEKQRIEQEKLRLEEEQNQKDAEIKKLQNKVLSKQKRVIYDDKNFIYIIQDEFHKKERIYIIGKAISLTQRLSTYNKARDYEVIYYRCCNSAQQMKYIEKCVLTKLDQYRDVANRDRFILPEDKDISLFKDVVDLFVNCFSDVDSSVDIEKDLTEYERKQEKDDTKIVYYEDHKEEILERRREYNENHKDKIYEYHRQYREDNKEALSVIQQEFKEINKEQINNFKKVYRENNKEKIEEYQKQYQQDNSEASKQYRKEYYEKHKEEIQEQHKTYREEHREEINEHHKRYYEENKEQFQQYKKEYYEENKESVIQAAKEYYEEHKEDVLERTKEHYKKNKERILAYQQEKVKCECGATIQRNYMAKHKQSQMHKISLEIKSKGKVVEENKKLECECGHKVRIGYEKRHLNSKIHEIAMKLKLEKS